MKFSPAIQVEFASLGKFIVNAKWLDRSLSKNKLLFDSYKPITLMRKYFPRHIETRKSVLRQNKSLAVGYKSLVGLVYVQIWPTKCVFASWQASVEHPK